MIVLQLGIDRSDECGNDGGFESRDILAPQFSDSEVVDRQVYDQPDSNQDQPDDEGIEEEAGNGEEEGGKQENQQVGSLPFLFVRYRCR